MSPTRKAPRRKKGPWFWQLDLEKREFWRAKFKAAWLACTTVDKYCPISAPSRVLWDEATSNGFHIGAFRPVWKAWESGCILSDLLLRSGPRSTQEITGSLLLLQSLNIYRLTTTMPPYFILKSIASTLRLLRKLLPAIKASPDEIKYIPSRDAGRSIKIHIYHPPPAASSGLDPRLSLRLVYESELHPDASEPHSSESPTIKTPLPTTITTSTTNPTTPTPTPVHLNLCGSGFVLPGHGLDDAYCRHLSTSVPTTVLDIEYRLSPENPFPAALHDVEDVIRWVQAQPETYDASRISIGGFSAGGALAVSLAGNLPVDTFCAVIAFYPACDASISPWKKKAPEGGGRPLPGWLLWVFQKCYLFGAEKGGSGGVRDTRISPALMEDLSRFPKRCLFVTAEQCNLADEAEGLGGRLAALQQGETENEQGQGERRVMVLRMEGCGHAWDKFAKEGSVQWERKERAYALAVEMLS
ncbi:alpha/beta-hydrolase [Aspergillus affinis]|uniref:alpha/beta-hydrolase n=1 Tax=Aspergillus affinis TaxID=1070780 RepID=UPI0022FE0392|nr:alpha/beta-hydrolase [Aspergillus affinis]KAI9043139.1 alpha/beta-hydrolase [Aspergillus affinis]